MWEKAPEAWGITDEESDALAAAVASGHAGEGLSVSELEDKSLAAYRWAMETRARFVMLEAVLEGRFALMMNDGVAQLIYRPSSEDVGLRLVRTCGRMPPRRGGRRRLQPRPQ